MPRFKIINEAASDHHHITARYHDNSFLGLIGRHTQPFLRSWS
jgi:hypothetical protein